MASERRLAAEVALLSESSTESCPWVLSGSESEETEVGGGGGGGLAGGGVGGGGAEDRW